MDDKTFPRILSERSFEEWIPSCPVQVKKVRISEDSHDSGIRAVITSCVCGDLDIESYTADITLLDERKQPITVLENTELKTGESEPVICISEKTVFVSVKITGVRYTSGEKWENADGSSGRKMPSQEIFWQTDPLYETVRIVCEGNVPAKYKPDTVDGAWRCACGQINLDGTKKCGGCGCAKEWLDTHLSCEYLEEQKKIADEKGEREVKKKVKKAEKGISDKVKALLILVGIVAFIALIVLCVVYIIPSIRYSGAEKLVENGEYDEAYAVFTDLGNFKDSSVRAADVNYKKAQSLTGIEKVNMTTSAAEPWFSITEEGVLSFVKTKYEDNGGTWNHFIVPDIVDGIVVRELDKNFLINCKELTVVTISDCVEVIGEQAFLNCEMLHTINFGKNIREIKQRAFIGCYALEKIEIPDTVTSLGLRAFNNCIKLNYVKLGSGITEIGSYLFSMCMELERISLCSPITSIGEYAFSECSSIEQINCNFPESEWIEPEIAEGNELYHNAEITFE